MVVDLIICLLIPLSPEEELGAEGLFDMIHVKLTYAVTASGEGVPLLHTRVISYY
jgi:hypothetical protein